MSELLFINTAYEFYPKEIDFIKQREAYTDTQKFKKLIAVLHNFHNKNADKLNSLKKEISSYPSIEKLEDMSSLDFDRCLTFDMDIVDETGKKLHKLRLVISAVIPFFFVYALENDILLNPYRWLTQPLRKRELEEGKFKDEINLITSIVKKVFDYDLFPEKYLKFVIPNVSFTDIREGDFTLFSAFFREEKFS